MTLDIEAMLRTLAVLEAQAHAQWLTVRMFRAAVENGVGLAHLAPEPALDGAVTPPNGPQMAEGDSPAPAPEQTQETAPETVCRCPPKWRKAIPSPGHPGRTRCTNCDKEYDS